MKSKSEIKQMPAEEKQKKLQELKAELIKSRVSSAKSGSSKTRQIKKAIARILTFNNLSEIEKIKAQKPKSHSNT